MSITTSICEHCYRHIPAETFERDNKVWIRKECEYHGNTEYVIENDLNFYNSLVYDINSYNPSGYVVEITDHCNLKCPHCYQKPNNRKQDVLLEDIIKEISKYPNDHYPITLAGAEPTLRKDLFQLIIEIKKLGRNVNLLTNGLKLIDLVFVENLINAGCDFITIGLNHPDYQGIKIHQKQLIAIENCKKLNLRIKNINYTLENLDQVPFILSEIQNFKDTAEEYRIRGGAEIGRYPDSPKLFLSDIVSVVNDIIRKENWILEKPKADDNLYHYMININGISHRLIQWADVKTVDLERLRCGPWGKFIKGVPLTNLMHQIILRDAAINMNLPLLDNVPERYQRND
jgi:organic radical activating enzyme